MDCHLNKYRFYGIIMLFIATGGTIDKMPVYLPDGSFDNDSKIFRDTHLPEMLDRTRYLDPRTIMNGQAFKAESVRKDVEAGVFKSLE